MFLKAPVSPYVFAVKGSRWSSKLRALRLCDQPFHFRNRAVRCGVRVIVQRHVDIGMAHDVLQRLGVHSRVG